MCVVVMQGTIHKGRPQNVRVFGPPPPLVRKFTQPPLWLLGLPPSPLSGHLLYEWSPTEQRHTISLLSTSLEGFKMRLSKTLLILGLLSFSINVSTSLPNIVFILLDDVDVDLTGLKV